MNNFNQLAEFQKELKKLSQKYPSLYEDLKKIEEIIIKYPTGIGKNFVIIHHSEIVDIIKARLACRSLKDRSVRLIYAYHKNKIEFIHIELYFKGDKENENRKRIIQYLRGME